MTLLRRIAHVAREAVLLELALYRSLARWVARRPHVPAVEVVVVEVVLRHVDQGWAQAIRLPVLVLGIGGVGWMLGMLASLRVRPHLLTDHELTARSGARTWAVVPLAPWRRPASSSTSCRG